MKKGLDSVLGQVHLSLLVDYEFLKKGPMICCTPDQGIRHFAGLSHTIFRFVLRPTLQMDISMSVLQMKKLRFREINLSEILSLTIQDTDTSPGQINFEAPLTNLLQCHQRDLSEISTSYVLSLHKLFPGPLCSRNSTQASNMTDESWVSFPLHPNLISCHHPFTSTPMLHSNISPFLYSYVCFQPPRPLPHTPPASVLPAGFLLLTLGSSTCTCLPWASKQYELISSLASFTTITCPIR